MKLYDVIIKDSPKKKTEKKVEHEFIRTEKPHKKRKNFLIILLTALGVIGLYILGIYLVRVNVYVQERKIPFSLEGTVLDIPHETGSESERLSFQTMTVTTDIQREVFGSELKEVTGKAKGAVVFFNEYSKNSQSIKSGTKLTGSNGKQYLTQQTVSVPGYTTDSAKKKVPGTSTSVSIIATEVGANSNSEGLSFTVSSYSGSKKSQITARSVGGIVGGDSGMRHTVSEAERPALLESLKTQLVERLKRETRAQIPEEFITYPELQFVSIDTDSLKLEGEGIKFTAQISGSMISYLIPIKLFESAIANEALSDHSYTSVSIPNIASLNVVPESPIPANKNSLADNISIKISGDGTIITKIPIQKLKESLIGAPRGSFDSKIADFSEISSAKFKMFPFWAPFFPKQDKFIDVYIK